MLGVGVVNTGNMPWGNPSQEHAVNATLNYLLLQSVVANLFTAHIVAKLCHRPRAIISNPWSRLMVGMSCYLAMIRWLPHPLNHLLIQPSPRHPVAIRVKHTFI